VEIVEGPFAFGPAWMLAGSVLLDGVAGTHARAPVPSATPRVRARDIQRIVQRGSRGRPVGRTDAGAQTRSSQGRARSMNNASAGKARKAGWSRARNAGSGAYFIFYISASASLEADPQEMRPGACWVGQAGRGEGISGSALLILFRLSSRTM
jgi:hypothetical protein